MSSIECPSQQELASLLLGKLPGEQAEPLYAHIDDCTGCQAAMDTLDVDSDTLLEKLRRETAEPNPYVQEAGCRRAVELVMAVGREPSFSLREGPAEPAAPALERIREYEILAEVGRGGMGTVYKAMHTRLKREVALKVLPADRLQNADAVSRFQREMEAVGKLDHPHIVRATDAGEHDETHYLVMEYVDGPNLSQLVKQTGPLPVADACELIRQTAVGLQHAHEHGLVHRDIKPSNLILATTHAHSAIRNRGTRGSGSSGIVKVLDLGLALLQSPRADAKELTSTGQLMGTLDYIAPEQAKNTHQVDIRADVYSLGCTLFKLLTGRAPFEGEQYQSPFEKMLAHTEEPLPSLTANRDDIPAELVAVVERMTAKNPNDRPATPAAVAEALSPFCAGHDLAALLERADTASAGATIADPRLSTTIAPISSQLSNTAVGAEAEPFHPQAAVAPLSVGEPPALTIPAQRRPKFVRVGVAAAALLLAMLGAVIFVNTGEGKLKLTVHNEDISVRIDGKQINITSPRDELIVKMLPAGRHEVEVTKDGFTSYTRKFRIFRNFETELEAEFLPLAAKPASIKPTGETKPTRWQPGSSENVIPGLVARPASFAGIKRWQVINKQPVSIVHSVSYSPDQRSIACGCHSGLIRIYEAKTLRLLRVLAGHTSHVTSVAYSPDGRQIVSGSGDQTVRLWLVDGKAGPILKGHTSEVNSVAYRPDGRQIASASNDGTIRLWSVEGKTGLILKGHEGRVQCVTYRADSQQFASGGEDKMVRLWSVDGTPGVVIDGHSEEVFSVAYRSDGQQLASGSEDKTVRLWSVDGTPGPVLEGHGQVVYSVAYRPDGEEIVSGSRDRTIRFWSVDGTPGRVIRHDSKSENISHIYSVAYRPDGQQIASGSHVRIRLWALDEEVAPFIEGSRKALMAVSFRPDGKQIVSGGGIGQSGKNSVRLWSIDGTPGPILDGHSMPVTSVAYRSDGRQIASGSWDGTVRLWSAEGTPGQVLEGSGGPVMTVRYHSDGQQIAASGYDNKTRIWLIDGTQKQVIKGRYFALRPDGQQIATSGDNNTIQFWSADGKPGIVLRGHPNGVLSKEYSPDGQQLVSVSGDHTIRLWAVDGTSVKVRRGPTDRILALAYRPDGRQFATGSRDNTIRLWSADGTLQLVLQGHFSEVRGLAYRHDSQQLASVGYSNTIRLWDAKTGEQQLTIYPLDDGRGATFSAGGELLHCDPAAIDDELVYVVEYDNSRQELLKPLEFAELAAHGERAPSSDADRRAAEWFARHKGWLKLRLANGREIEVPPAKLPDEPFDVIGLRSGYNDQSKVLDATDFSVLKGLRKLKLVVLARAMHFGDRELALLRDCRELEYLDLYYTKVTTEGIRQLQCPRPSSIYLPPAASTDESMEHLAKVCSPQQLGLQASGPDSLTDRGLRSIAGMVRLEQLTLFPAQNVTAAGIAELRGLPRLKGLSLKSVGQMNVAMLETLEHFPALRGLSLEYNKLTENDVARLGRLTQLENLNLNWTPIDDAALFHLHGLTNLKRLYVNRTRVTAAGIASLRQALPQCEIIADPPSKWQPTPEQQQFLNAVAKLPPTEQVEAVRKKLREVNPGFDGRIVHGIEGGAVIKISFYSSDDVTEIWPLRGFPQLSILGCAGSEDGHSQLSNLKPLAGMRLSRLDCGNTQIADLSPLKGMPLDTLYFAQTDVADLTPLQGLPLLRLQLDVRLYDTQQHEFLRSLGLEQLSDGRSRGGAVAVYWKRVQSRRAAAERFAKSTAELSGEDRVDTVRARLRELNSQDVEFRHVIEEGQVVEATLTLTRKTHDLTPLTAFAGLKTLRLSGGNNWFDVSPITQVPLEELTCKDAIAIKNSLVLKGIASLKTINNQPATKYWQALPAKMNPKTK